MAVVCFDFSRIFTVRFPVPGPTSMTLSVGLRFAFNEHSENTILKSHDDTDCVYYSKTKISTGGGVPTK